MVRATIASVVTGTGIYWLVLHVGLPALVEHATESQVDWLRERWYAHPFGVLATVLAAAAVLALPVLVAFRLAYGPFHTRPPD